MNNYNRNLAKNYAEKYALNPNSQYPYFKDNDCANFVSQVLRAGGIEEVGSRWDDVSSWFCRTNDIKNLTKISITWRAARYFRRYWGNENGLGMNKAAVYTSMTAKQALDSFDMLVSMLDIGDVIQYGNPNNGGYPYHTQVIHDKGLNIQIGKLDLFLAQHTVNRLYISFYEYLMRFTDKNIRPVYIYKITEEKHGKK